MKNYSILYVRVCVMRAADWAVRVLIWWKFEVIQVLINCKNEEDPFKNEGTRVVTVLYIDFSDAQGQLTP